AVLDGLVERLPTARMLLLVNYRPEYQHAWGTKTYYTQLPIDPLPPDGAKSVLRALLGDDVARQPLGRLLIDRAEGNPFFLEESVRTLVETRPFGPPSSSTRRAVSPIRSTRSSMRSRTRWRTAASCRTADARFTRRSRRPSSDSIGTA